jgi:hypothetical protein
MFEHFVIKNFRCFSGLHLKQLCRVNLIAGKNNTGKTALLEAIHLHNSPNNCQLPVLINKHRGVVEPEKAFSNVIGWLFYGMHPETGLDLSSFDEKGINRTLSMYVLDGATARARFGEAVKELVEAMPGGQWNMVLGGLVLRYEQTGEQPRFSWAAPTQFGTGMTWVSGRIPWSIPSVFLASGISSQDQDVKFFGEVELAKRQDEVLPALRILEPQLQKLALVPLISNPALFATRPVSSLSPLSSISPGSQASPVLQSDEAMIHGDIGLPRLVPLPFMGEGTRRLLSIVLAIANARGGVVLIDEIENGLHYSVMKDVWKAIALAARQMDVQVFATTHSWECIQAAHHAFKEEGPYELAYYRLDRTKDGIEVKSMDEQMLTRIEATDLEVR